jgi:capsular polysaccharide biosynthesis protein
MAETYTSRTLREIVRVIAGRFIGMVILLVVVVGAVGAATWLQPRQYRSEAVLKAKPVRAENPLEGEATLRESVSLFVTTQRQIILSDHVVASALLAMEQGLKIDPQQVRPEPWYSDERIGQYIGRNVSEFRATKRRVSVVTPGGPDATFTQTFTVRVDALEDRDEADSRRKAAERAYKLNQYIVQAYRNRAAYLRAEESKRAATYLTQEALGLAVARWQKAERDWEKFVAEELKGDLQTVMSMIGTTAVSGIEAGVASQATAFQSEIYRIDARLGELNTLKEVLDEQLKAFAGKADKSGLVVPESVIAINPTIRAFLDNITALKIKLSNLTSQFTEDYQGVERVKREIAAVEEALYSELAKQKTRVELQIREQEGRRTALQKKVVDALNERKTALSLKAAKAQRLATDRAAARSALDKELERAATGESAQRLPIMVALLDAPSRPDPSLPRRPIVWLNMLIAVVGGAILALVYAFLADHFDHTIKSIDDVERYLGMPVLGSVPKLGRVITR